MGGQVGPASVERQLPPSATERRDSAVAVLKIEKPLHARCGGPALALAGRAEPAEGQQRSGRVVAVGHGPGQIGPGPAAGIGLRVGVRLPILQIQEPLAQRGAIFAIELGQRRIGLGQGIDRERRDPDREVRVDRPASVLSGRIDEE